MVVLLRLSFKYLEDTVRLVASAGMIVIATLTSPVDAQVIPDTTLGTENSVVTEDIVRGVVSDRISGGARRDINLFHGFQQFDVPASRGAYFENPAGVQNIFSRVTGSDRSEIFGRLGIIQAGSTDILGTANLFFVNPNGILFGATGSLDVGGSFVATTANAIGFGDRGSFSATNPSSADSILTIDPSAFLFNQTIPASIVYNSSTVTGTPSPILGLQVPPNQSLILLGGEIVIDNGRLSSPEGRIELVGLAAPGTINLTRKDGTISTSIPDRSSLANISLTNFVLVDTGGSRGGAIDITGNRVNLDNGSTIASLTFGNQDGRDISITALHLDIANFSTISTTSTALGLGGVTNSGSGGNIRIRTETLDIRNNSLLNTLSGYSFGNAGDIDIQATRAVTLLTSPGDLVVSGIGSLSLGIGSLPSLGSPGNITINTRDFRAQNSGILTTSFLGQSRSRDLTISATNLIELQSSFLRTNSIGGGAGGNIFLKAPVVLIRNGSAVATDSIDPQSLPVDRLNTSFYSPALIALFQQLIRDPANLVNAGQGNSGNISVDAAESLELSGTSGNTSSSISTQTSGAGQAGTLKIQTNRLDVRDGAFISTSTTASGQGGTLEVAADTVRLSGVVGRNPSAIGSVTSASENAGKAGDVAVSTRLLTIFDGAKIVTSTNGSGQGGDLRIRADIIQLNGFDAGGETSAIGSQTNALQNAGRAGNVNIATRLLELQNGAFISTSGLGDGQAGSIFLSADSMNLNGLTTNPQFFTSIESQAKGLAGNAGAIDVNTRLITLMNGAFIATGTFGSGSGGNLNVTIRESGEFEGSRPLVNGQKQPSGLFTGTSGSGRAGDLRLSAQQLDVVNGAAISARSAGQGQAGNLMIDVSRRLELIGSSITTQAPSSSGGNITINPSPSSMSGLTLLRSGDIRTNSLQDGGNITIGGAGFIAFDDSDIVASSNGAAGGSITFITPAVFLESFNRSTIQQGINRSTAADTSDGNSRVEVISTGRTQGGTINLPDVSFIENSLGELQQTAIDLDTLIANSCIARTQQGGTFLITGAEGLRDRPGDPFTSSYPLGTVRPLPTATPSPRSWQPGDPIVEPQGAYRLPSGRIVMSRECFN